MTEIENTCDPSSLFQYCGINKNCLSMLARREIYLSAPSDFNDPFDCALSFSMINSREEAQEHLLSVAESRGNPEPDETELEKMLEEMNELLLNVNKQIQAAGVYCLTKTPLNMLMWSHYANQHRGICIEFERATDNALGSDECIKVDYLPSTKFFVDGLDFFREPENNLIKAIRQKLCKWSYEEEWRLVYVWREPNNANRFHPLPGNINSITFGAKASKDDVNLIVNACRLAELNQVVPIKFFRIHLDYSTGLLLQKEIEQEV